MRIRWNSIVRQTLGLHPDPNKKLPVGGRKGGLLLDDGRYFRVELLPLEERNLPRGFRHRRMQHRVVVHCPCGRPVSAGRMNQHICTRGIS